MSYTLKYTGAEIDDILDRAVEGGTIDEDLALKAPLESPALTGTPTAPTPAASDNSTKVATTAYADRAAAGAAAAAYPVDTALGAIASFPDGADNVPMKSVKVSIEPIQSGSGDPSPSNVRPIDGWEGATVTRTGKNILNPTGESGTTSGITKTKNSDGSYTVSGGNTASSAVAILAGEWEAKAGVTYTLNGCPSGGSNNSYRLDIRTSPTTPYQGTPVDTGSGVDITPSADATLYVYMRFASGYSISGSLSFKPMIRLSSESDATFVPYNGSTVNIDWTDEAGKVYGGTLDVTTGVLTVTHGIVTYTGAAGESWTYGSSRFRIARADMVATVSPRVKVLSNIGHYAASGSEVGTIFGSGGDIYYYADPSITTPEAFKTWLGANNMQVVYPLATPTTVQLDPITVSSLLGPNNLYADCGDVEVEYRADVALYIEKKLGGGVSTLSMAPSAQPAVVRPVLSLNLTEDEPELITEDDEPDLAEDAPEALEE